MINIKEVSGSGWSNILSRLFWKLTKVLKSYEVYGPLASLVAIIIKKNFELVDTGKHGRCSVKISNGMIVLLTYRSEDQWKFYN